MSTAGMEVLLGFLCFEEKTRFEVEVWRLRDVCLYSARQEQTKLRARYFAGSRLESTQRNHFFFSSGVEGCCV